MRLHRIATALLLALSATFAPAATFKLSSSESFLQALKTAKPGDTIRIGPGDYTGINFSRPPFDKTGVVTVELDPKAIVYGLTLASVSGYHFKGGVFAAKDNGQAVLLKGVRDVTFEGMKVTQRPQGADVAETRTLRANGVKILGGENITIKGGDFGYLGFGVAHVKTTGLKVLDNVFHDMSNDGIRGTSSNLFVAGNTCTDFYAGLQRDGNRVHFDCIQLWTVDGPLENVRILNNRAIRGKGDTVTLLQFGDEADRGQGVNWTEIKAGYRNLEVSGNLGAGGGNCLNIGGAIEPKIYDNVCAGTQADVHPVMNRKTGQLVEARIWPVIRLSRSIGGDIRGNAGPGKPTFNKPFKTADVGDNYVVPELMAKQPGDYTEAEAWWAKRKAARAARD